MSIKWSKEDIKNWAESIERYYGIPYVTNLVNYSKSTLFTTGCSAKKSGKERGIPKEMYQGNKNLAFYNTLERNKLDYGILSDFLGIVFKDEVFDDYNVHPSDINDQIKKQLGDIVANKVTQRGYDQIYFYNTSPLQSRPYFEILQYSGIKSYFITQLSLIDNLMSEEVDLF